MAWVTTGSDVVWVGIDAGKTSHHAVAIDTSGKKLWSGKVTNGQQPIEELVNRVADTARMRSDLTELSATDELVVELTQLTSYRADVMADWVRGINRLRSLLTSIFPALEASFDYSTRSALILLSGY